MSLPTFAVALETRTAQQGPSRLHHPHHDDEGNDPNEGAGTNNEAADPNAALLIERADDGVVSAPLTGLDTATALTRLCTWLEDETRSLLRAADVPRPMDLFTLWAKDAPRARLEGVGVGLYRVVQRTLETVHELALANGAAVNDSDESASWSLATMPIAESPSTSMGVAPQAAASTVDAHSPAASGAPLTALGCIPNHGLNSNGAVDAIRRERAPTAVPPPVASSTSVTTTTSPPQHADGVTFDPLTFSHSAMDGRPMALTPTHAAGPAAASAQVVASILPASSSGPTATFVAGTAAPSSVWSLPLLMQSASMMSSLSHLQGSASAAVAAPPAPASTGSLRSIFMRPTPAPPAGGSPSRSPRGAITTNNNATTWRDPREPPTDDDGSVRSTAAGGAQRPVLSQFAPVAAVTAAAVVGPPVASKVSQSTSTGRTASTSSRLEGESSLVPIERDSQLTPNRRYDGEAAASAATAPPQHESQHGNGSSSSANNDACRGSSSGDNAEAAARVRLLYRALEGTKSQYALYLSRHPSSVADTETAAAAADGPAPQPPNARAHQAESSSSETTTTAKESTTGPSEADSGPVVELPTHNARRPDWSNNEALQRFFAGNATVSLDGSVHLVMPPPPPPAALVPATAYTTAAGGAHHRPSIAASVLLAAAADVSRRRRATAAPGTSHTENEDALHIQPTEPASNETFSLAPTVPAAAIHVSASDFPRVLVYNTSTVALPPASPEASAASNERVDAPHPRAAAPTTMIARNAATAAVEHVEESNTDFERIGPWMMVDRLGAGKQGEVHLAVHETTGQCCAIKKMRKTKPKSLHAQVQREQLNRELSLSLSFTHPNIVKALELIKPKRSEYVFLVMELMPGGALAHVQDDGTCNTLPLPALHKVARQAVSALRYLHGMKVVHRDIKPDNFLLDAAGNIQLSDFGVCVFNDPADRHGVAAQQVEGFAGQGALSYRAPEEFIEASRAAGPHVDMWSLGVSLYAMTFGALPFRAETYEALRSAICNRDPDYTFTTAALVEREAGDEHVADPEYALALQRWEDEILKPLLRKSRHARLRARGLEAALGNLQNRLSLTTVANAVAASP